jgi:hypothetical protein
MVLTQGSGNGGRRCGLNVPSLLIKMGMHTLHHVACHAVAFGLVGWHL